MTSPKEPLNSPLADELAALYALNLLDPDEQNRVDPMLTQDDAFIQQVNDFQMAAAAMSYSTPPVPMAENLKARLWQRISQVESEGSSALLTLLERAIDDLKQQAAELTWEPMMGSDAEMAVWQTDDARREVAFFVRKSTGGLFPNHAHAGGETVLVLAGDFVANGQVYGVGDRATSMAHTTHQPSTQQGCLLLCISSMDDEVLS
ncbi:MAG: anti-sigma factor [Leptolyngbya sp. SIO1D8]|nr:anti-sigma factor [Leptolyngbya sp. SIO1D8]